MVIKKLLAGKKVGRFRKAVLKMAAIVLYYIVVGVLYLMTFIYIEENRERLRETFLCYTVGNQECGDQTISNLLFVMAFAFHAFLPVVVVLFSFHPKVCMKAMKTSFKHLLS